MQDVLGKYGSAPNNDHSFLYENTGNKVLKYSSGHALTMAPFFFIGHFIALNSNQYESDGFSYPYQKSIGIGMLLYAFIGLFFLRKFLVKHFEDNTVTFFLIVLVIGTNYLNYVAIDLALTHNVLFALYAILLYTTDKFYKNPNLVLAFVIGAACGLLTLIRPSEIISVIIPLFWGISFTNFFSERLTFMALNYKKYLLAIFVLIAIGSIQLIYWKTISGNWFVYSYEDQGFSWLNPHLNRFNFSFCCGWLRFTPMLLLFFPAIIVYFFTNNKNWGIIFFLVLNYYIVMAWDVWDYGGFSGRAMVQSYAAMSLPFYFFIEKIRNYKIINYILLAFVLFSTYYNIWWTHQIHLGELKLYRPTKHYYIATVLKWKIDENYVKLLDTKHSFRGVPKESVELYFNDLKSDDKTASLELNVDNKISPIYSIQNINNFKNWVRITAEYEISNKEWNVNKQVKIVVSFEDKYGGIIQENNLKVERFLESKQQKSIYIDCKPPSKEWAKLSILFWNGEGQKITYISNLKVETF